MIKQESYKKKLRRYPRTNLYLEADYQVILLSKEKTAIPFETENIGIGGLMFYSYDRIKIGKHLDINLYVDKLPVRFSAKVVWRKEWLNPDNWKTIFAIGLVYTKISPQAVSKISETTSKVVLLQCSNKEE